MPRPTKPEESETIPLGQVRVRPTSNRYAIVAYHREGATPATLSPGDSVVIGRARPSDLLIRDESVSREHARFEVREDRIVVSDLGSTNGIMFDGDVVSSASLTAGQEVTLGNVLVRIEAVPAGTPRPKGLDSHDRFCDALDDEISRAGHFHRPMAVLFVKNADGSHIAKLSPALVSQLRKVDRAALYSPGCIEVALAETNPAMAAELAKKLLDAGHKMGQEIQIGAACFPGDGRTGAELLAAARDALARCDEQQPMTYASELLSLSVSSDGPLVPEKGPMVEVMALVDKLARSTIPVLVSGETGSGKEVIARALHERSARKKGPMVSVNCGAISSHLVESTLFGHEKGAFTGAVATKKGVFEAATGGTVFLDEIGELKAEAQAALLRVLETGRVTRVGATREIAVDARIVAASHRDLEAMTVDGSFRLDLLYRLNAMTIAVPPLRNRKDEIGPLALRFLAGARLKERDIAPHGLSPVALDLLKAWSWPGNVRELKNAIERAAVICQKEIIEAEDLPQCVRDGAPPMQTHSIRRQDLPPMLTNGASYKETMRNYEQQLLLRALADADGVQKTAAQNLGMPLRTFVHKLKTLGIKRKADGYKVISP